MSRYGKTCRLGIDYAAPCKRCGRAHAHLLVGVPPSARFVDSCPGRWTTRIARRLAEALAALSKLVGQ